MGYFSDNTLTMLRKILRNTEKILSGLSDLQTVDAALQAIVLKILTDIQTALANDDSDTAVEAASVIVNQAVTDLTNADTGLTTPPPPPAS